MSYSMIWERLLYLNNKVIRYCDSPKKKTNYLIKKAFPAHLKNCIQHKVFIEKLLRVKTTLEAAKTGILRKTKLS